MRVKVVVQAKEVSQIAVITFMRLRVPSTLSIHTSNATAEEEKEDGQKPKHPRLERELEARYTRKSVSKTR